MTTINDWPNDSIFNTFGLNWPKKIVQNSLIESNTKVKLSILPRFYNVKGLLNTIFKKVWGFEKYNL